LEGTLEDTRLGSFGDLVALGFGARGIFGVVEGTGGVKEEGGREGSKEHEVGVCEAMSAWSINFLDGTSGVYTLNREKKNRGGMKTWFSAFSFD